MQQALRPDADGVTRRDPMTHDADELLLGFARALRAAGVPVTQDRARGYLEAVAALGLDDRRATYLAGRATLCAGPDDLDRYDQVFEAYFLSRDGLPSRRRRCRRASDAARPARVRGRRAARGTRTAEDLRAAASATEVLRHRDVGRPVGRREAAAGGHVRDPGAATARRRTARHQRVAPRRRRRLPHPARAACAGWASPPRSPGAGAAPGRDGWCCWSTSPAR